MRSNKGKPGQVLWTLLEHVINRIDDAFGGRRMEVALGPKPASAGILCMTVVVANRQRKLGIVCDGKTTSLIRRGGKWQGNSL